MAIKLEKRDETKNPRQVRAEGKIPGTIYGPNKESVSVQIDRRTFVAEYKKNKDTEFEYESTKAKVKNIQIDHKTQDELNIEFYTK